MTIIQGILIKYWTVLVLAGVNTIDQVPTTSVTLTDGTTSTIKDQVSLAVASKTV